MLTDAPRSPGGADTSAFAGGILVVVQPKTEDVRFTHRVWFIDDRWEERVRALLQNNNEASARELLALLDRESSDSAALTFTAPEQPVPSEFVALRAKHDALVAASQIVRTYPIMAEGAQDPSLAKDTATFVKDQVPLEAAVSVFAVHIRDLGGGAASGNIAFFTSRNRNVRKPPARKRPAKRPA
jgi:hypothetical protein